MLWMTSFSDFEINISNTENNKLGMGMNPIINMKLIYFSYISYTQSEDFSVLFV